MVFFPHYCLGKSIINIYVRYAKRLKCLHPNQHDNPTLTFYAGIPHFFVDVDFLREKKDYLKNIFYSIKIYERKLFGLILQFTSILFLSVSVLLHSMKK